MSVQSDLAAKQRDAIAEHVQGKLDEAAAAAPAEGTAPAETPALETAPPASEGTPPGTETVTPPAAPAETPAPAEGTAEEPPTTYYGIEIPGTAEERSAVLEGLSGRDKHIQKLLREAAEAPAEVVPVSPPAAPAPAVEPQTETSDEDILIALGLNPAEEDMDDPRVKAIIGLGKFSLDLQAEVAGVKAGVAVRETETLWTTQLDALEQQYGNLPESITRDDVLAHAAKAGIAEPVDAYWRIMGPARAEVLEAVKARRDVAEKTLKKGVSPVKPRSEGELAPAPLEAKNTKDAVKEAMLRLEKSGQYDFGRE